MRILVLGATGYVGSRLVPALLDAGHEVVAASSSPPDPGRFAWGHEVEWARCDVTDETAVREAVADVDGVCYLVHSLNVRGFVDRDRAGAEVVRDAVREQRRTPGRVPLRSRPRRTRRASCPDTSPRASRSSRCSPRPTDDRCSVLSLRAGVVIGAGSTSFEVIRQLSTLLLVQPVPSWLEHRVQPIAVSDVLRAWWRPSRTTTSRARSTSAAPACCRTRSCSPSPRVQPACCGCGCPPSRCRRRW